MGPRLCLQFSVIVVRSWLDFCRLGSSLWYRDYLRLEFWYLSDVLGEFIRSWWSCGEAPRGFQLTMLFLTWALLFLLLCMPPMANAEIGTVQADTECLTSLGDGPEIVSSSEGAIREVTSKGKSFVQQHLAWTECYAFVAIKFLITLSSR